MGGHGFQPCRLIHTNVGLVAAEGLRPTHRELLPSGSWTFRLDVSIRRRHRFWSDSLTVGRQCSYNESYSTLKIEWYGVVITLEDLA
jgi:hypothetical protein